MRTVAIIVGVLAILGVLVGFVRSLWGSPGKPNGEGNAESMAGMPTTSSDHHYQDTGSQGGFDGGGN